MDGAKAVKRHNAQYDIFNRLHSIASDQTFVQKVANEWYEGRFEIVRKAVDWIYGGVLTSSKSAVWDMVLSS